MIRIDNISVSIGQKEILHRIRAEISPGITCIIGPNGSGKTMLLRAIAGLLKPAEGRILIHGSDVFALDRKQRAQQLAYLPQMRPIPQIEARVLVAHARHPYNGFSNRVDAAGKALVEQAMVLTNTMHLADKKLPQLSGGERQRVYIASALAQDTSILLLDEPTTYLDLKTQLELLRLIRSLAAKGKSIVMVLHDIVQAFCFADRLIILHDGRLVIEGSPAALCAKDILRDVFGCLIIGDPAPDMVYQYRLAYK